MMVWYNTSSIHSMHWLEFKQRFLIIIYVDNILWTHLKIINYAVFEIQLNKQQRLNDDDLYNHNVIRPIHATIFTIYIYIFLNIVNGYVGIL